MLWHVDVLKTENNAKVRLFQLGISLKDATSLGAVKHLQKRRNMPWQCTNKLQITRHKTTHHHDRLCWLSEIKWHLNSCLCTQVICAAKAMITKRVQTTRVQKFGLCVVL